MHYTHDFAFTINGWECTGELNFDDDGNIAWELNTDDNISKDMAKAMVAVLEEIRKAMSQLPGGKTIKNLSITEK